ncbi:GlxA family transcriptional regulator [Ideonella sp. BN130291]|uniref:GlxA family transcriptional regulator n=1 Tax=Ideonella sp. BN130291 TaxID=3112940 RepID=UPI002E25CA3A|nr:helix-turn-helix domain-containing protein [Ideonella sp. BN130291]
MSASRRGDDRPPLRLRLLWLPEALPGTVFSALDVVRAAAGIAQLQRPDAPPRIVWQVLTGSGRNLSLPFLEQPSRLRVPPSRTVLVIPALNTRNAPHVGEVLARSPAALRTVERHMTDGGWLAACANGVALPAALGLLDGARVAAPWPYQSWMARQYPHCDWSADEAFSAAGRCFSCVAPALMSEFMLRVLGHVHDPDLAQAVAQVLLHQPQRQQLTPALVAKRWLSRTSDSPVYRAMQYLQDHIDQPYRLAPVAAAAAVSERTLLRHFGQVTGMTPLAYLHGLRIERAKMLLEVTLHGVQGVAEACGYADAAAFRRLFQRETGMSMSQYRVRFALRSRRRFWRVEDARAE